jgi:hypothetical protein
LRSRAVVEQGAAGLPPRPTHLRRTGTVNRGAQSAILGDQHPYRGGSSKSRIQPRVWRAPHPALPSPPPPRQG